MNPVLAREIRSRVRDWRSPLLVAAYVGAMGAVGLLFYQSQVPGLLQGHVFGPEIGLNVFILLAFFQLFLISFILPAISAGSISGEKERQTFDLLWVTKLSARSIILGKLAASMAYMMLVIVATAPLYAVIFLFGGLAWKSVALTLLCYIGIGITLSSLSILASTITRRTMVATVVAYGLVFMLVVGSAVVATLEYNAISRRPPDPANPWRLPPKSIYLNPLVALSSTMPGGSSRMGLPFFGSVLRARPVLVYAPSPASVGPGIAVAPPAPPPAPELRPAWQYNLMFNAIIVVASLGASIVLVNPGGPAAVFGLRKSKKAEPGDVS